MIDPADDVEQVLALLNKEAVRLVRFLDGFVSSSAEDVLQNVAERAIVKAGDVTAHPNPRAMLYRVAHDMAVDLVRSDSARCRREEADGRRAAVGDPAPFDCVDLRVDVSRALAQLSNRERTCVFLRHCVGLPINEVAFVVGIQSTTVATYVRRAVSKLRVLLGEDHSEGDHGA